MTNEKQYLADILRQHAQALNTSDETWRKAHLQHIERLAIKLKRELDEE